jgi:hypothetical protein
VAFVLITFVVAGVMVFPPIATYARIYTILYGITFVMIMVTAFLFLSGWWSGTYVRGAFAMAHFLVFPHYKKNPIIYFLIFVIISVTVLVCVV